MSGDAVVEEYVLNVTTQRISQKYEENDRLAAAANLEIDDPDFEFERQRASRAACRGYGGTDGGAAGPGAGSDPGPGAQLCQPLHWWTTEEAAAGYSPGDPDWYFLEMREGESFEVNLNDERLGIEVYHDGNRVAETDGQYIKHVARDNASYYVNVTGDEYVSTHLIDYSLTAALAVDGREPNDRPTTATAVSAGTGNETTRYSDLLVSRVDTDQFAVELADGDQLNATLTYRTGAESADAPLDLVVVAPDGTTVESVRVTAPTASNLKERVELTTQQSGTYYVVVEGTGAAHEYDLTIETEKSASAASPGFGIGVAVIAILVVVLTARVWSIRRE